MLEVTFSESACGSLKVAQHYGEGKEGYGQGEKYDSGEKYGQGEKYGEGEKYGSGEKYGQGEAGSRQ